MACEWSYMSVTNVFCIVLCVKGRFTCRYSVDTSVLSAVKGQLQISVVTLATTFYYLELLGRRQEKLPQQLHTSLLTINQSNHSLSQQRSPVILTCRKKVGLHHCAFIKAQQIYWLLGFIASLAEWTFPPMLTGSAKEA